jgi:hypothetical protein
MEELKSKVGSILYDIQLKQTTEYHMTQSFQKRIERHILSLTDQDLQYLWQIQLDFELDRKNPSILFDYVHIVMIHTAEALKWLDIDSAMNASNEVGGILFRGTYNIIENENPKYLHSNSAAWIDLYLSFLQQRYTICLQINEVEEAIEYINEERTVDKWRSQSHLKINRIFLYVIE